MAPPTRSGVEDYLDQPYEIAVVRREGDDGMGWTAQVPELPGCTVRGRSEEEAIRGVRAAMAEWIADALANDRPVPAPRAAASHSGRLLVRMPQSLHADLARLADRESVSLNALIVAILGGAVAWRQPAPAQAGEPRGAGPRGAAARAPAPAPGPRPAPDPARSPGSPASAPAPDPPSDRGRLLATALSVNLVVVAVAAVVAVALLVTALVA
jgi:predicted RNase H-like HicB family nuclease